jgi:hypothetical protein
LRIRVASDRNNSRALMQEGVIGVVLADHKIATTVVAFLAINVMNL